MKKTFSSLLLLAALPILAAAQSYKEHPTLTVRLYPEGQTGGKGIVENGIKITEAPVYDNGLREEETCTPSGNRRNVGDEARMDIYIPDQCNGIMILDCPGGGYELLSTYNEGAYGAEWALEKGFAFCVLKYRMPNGRPGAPLEDVHNAFRYLRYHSAEWGVKLIGIMGSSAGGHLASIATVKWKDEVTRPDFSVLMYPRISLYRGEDTSTKNNLLGSDEVWKDRIGEQAFLLREWSADNHVDSRTPPAFFVMSADDRGVEPWNYLPYYSKLVKNDISVEVHIYPTGGHGWGFSSEKFVGKGNDRFSAYREDFYVNLERWLKERLK